MKTAFRRHALFLLAFALVLCVPSFGVGAQVRGEDFSQLQGEFWLDYQPMGADGPLPPPSADDATRALLDEARSVFSGMIYGFDFVYKPSDSARQISDSFTLDPVFIIPWGDPNLSYVQTRSDQNSVWLRVRYFPKKSERSLLEAWATRDPGDAGGIGFGSYFDGVKGKTAAIQEAVKDAIRSYARGLTHNKPSRIAGRVVLETVPRVFVAHGQYRAELKVKIALDSIEPYRSF